MTPIQEYFDGEKTQCTLGLILALLFIGLAIFFLVQVKTDYYRGMAYPFLAIPVLLFVICVTIILRAPEDMIRVTKYAIEQPTKIRTEEIPRMEKVIRNFKLIKIVEIAFILAGIGMFFLATKYPMIKGAGMGLTIQSTMLLIFDLVAEKRGSVYIEYLRSITGV